MTRYMFPSIVQDLMEKILPVSLQFVFAPNLDGMGMQVGRWRSKEGKLGYSG